VRVAPFTLTIPRRVTQLDRPAVRSQLSSALHASVNPPHLSLAASPRSSLGPTRMSSFRRRTAVQPMAGTRPSPYNAAPLVSTGLTSIDDLLGGGLPLSTSLLIEADSPTSYADLLLRYWVAQGLECGQDVLVVASGLDGGPEGVVEALMDVDGGRSAQAAPLSKEDATDDEEERKQEEALKEKMKIAFRYEGLRPHQTTVDASRGCELHSSLPCRSSVWPLTHYSLRSYCGRQRDVLLRV